jgi:general secretion pathway protein K
MKIRDARARGAALLLAMLTVALVASLSAAAYWQQWRSFELEQTARQRAQALWLLTGALDWARLILREDGRGSDIDHLGEPWAVPLQETRLSSFVAGAADGAGADEGAFDARLSGRISDEQGKLNLRNLIEGADQQVRLVEAERQSFEKLFRALGLPASELEQLLRQLLLAYDPGAGNEPQRPLRPLCYEQLTWLGLSQRTLEQLAPHATWLPETTPLNLNTASALALHASLPGLNLAQAQMLVAQRERRHFTTIEALRELAPGLGEPLDSRRHSVMSRHFRVHGRLRLDGTTLEQDALVVRDQLQVSTLWRMHGGLQRQAIAPE